MEALLRAPDAVGTGAGLPLVRRSAWRRSRASSDSPVAPLWNRLGAFLYEHGEAVYNFQGLRAYKEKFDPAWEPHYLAYPGGLRLPRIMADVSALVAGGYRQIFRKVTAQRPTPPEAVDRRPARVAGGGGAPVVARAPSTIVTSCTPPSSASGIAPGVDRRAVELRRADAASSGARDSRR